MRSGTGKSRKYCFNTLVTAMISHSWPLELSPPAALLIAVAVEKEFDPEFPRSGDIDRSNDSPRFTIWIILLICVRGPDLRYIPSKSMPRASTSSMHFVTILGTYASSISKTFSNGAPKTNCGKSASLELPPHDKVILSMHLAWA